MSFVSIVLAVVLGVWLAKYIGFIFVVLVGLIILFIATQKGGN